MQHTLPSHQAVTGLKTNTGHHRWAGWHASQTGGLAGVSPRVGGPCGVGIAVVEADAMTHLKQGPSGAWGLRQVDLLTPHPPPDWQAGTGQAQASPMPSAGKTFASLWRQMRKDRTRGSKMKFKWFLQGDARQLSPRVWTTQGSAGAGAWHVSF